MSFPNFGEAGAQPQQPAQEHGGFGATGGPDQQQNPMGQQMDPQQMGQQMGQQQMGQQMGQQQMGQQQMGQQQMGQQQMGQQMDQSQPQGQFQGAPTSGTPGAQGGQPQEGKTTLWWVKDLIHDKPGSGADNYTGWASLSLGSMRTSCAPSGSAWATRSMSR
jgi:hypothetical protein